MSSLASRLFGSVVSLWHRLFSQPAVVTVPDLSDHAVIYAPPPPAQRNAPAKPVDDDDDDGPIEFGQYSFKGDILDHLDQCLFFTKRLKLADLQAYKLYSQIGACIAPKRWAVSKDLEPWWVAGNRPAFGAVFHNFDDKENLISAQLMYFMRYDQLLQNVQAPPKGGTVYRVSMLYDTRQIKHYLPAVVVFHVSILPDGTIVLLKERHLKTIHIKTRARRGRQRGQRHISRLEWGHSPTLKHIAENHENGRVPRTPEKFANMVMCILANSHWQINTGIQVRATKGSVSAVFSIADHVAPKFFADREVSVTENGNRKRIFHAVRAHKRGGADKRAPSAVRLHFRGVRSFIWNGYSVSISIPGLHHSALTETNFGALELAANALRPKGMFDSGQMGKKIAEHLTTDVKPRLRRLKRPAALPLSTSPATANLKEVSQ